MEAVFQKIFDDKSWGADSEGFASSGPGSRFVACEDYISYLEKFIIEHSVKSIVDIGCGDWQFSQFVKWDGIEYIGTDCVQKLIDRNSEKFGSDNIKFVKHDAGKTENLLKSDLYLIKDVMQHWKNDDINKFLSELKLQKSCKYILITNCYQQKFENEELKNYGDSRFLDARMSPLKDFGAQVIKSFGSKQISLIRFN